MKLQVLFFVHLLLVSPLCFSKTEFQRCHKVHSEAPCEWLAMSPEMEKPIQITLQQLSESYAGLVQRISKVRFVEEFPGTASVGPNESALTINGYTLVLSKKAQEYKQDMSGFLTWKESQFLKGVSSERLPRVQARIPTAQFPALYYIILHELGHIAWYEGGVDKVVCESPRMSARPYWEAAFFLEEHLLKSPARDYKSLRCEYTADSFISTAWSRAWVFDDKDRLMVSRRPEFNVTELGKICFYGCTSEPTWTDREIQDLYSKLYALTPFTTVYSAYFKPEEDFAESFAFYHLASLPGAEYKLILPQSLQFDLLSKVSSGLFQEKRKLLEGVHKDL